MQTSRRKNVYLYILSSDVKSPWKYNPVFFVIVYYAIECLCIECSFIRFLKLIIRLFQFFFSSDNPCVESSSFEKLCFMQWQFLVFICFFNFSLRLPSDSRMQLYLSSEKKVHFNFYRNRSPVYPGLFFVIWHPRWMVLLLINCKKAGPLFGYD